MKKLSFKTLKSQKNIKLPQETLHQIKGGSVVNFLEIQNGGTLTIILNSSSSTNG